MKKSIIPRNQVIMNLITYFSRTLVEVGMICNNAENSDINGGAASGTPTEKALLALAEQFGILSDRGSHERIQEVPFSSERKFMSVRCRDLTSSLNYFVKGAPEEVLSRCKFILKHGNPDLLTQVRPTRLYLLI